MTPEAMNANINKIISLTQRYDRAEWPSERAELLMEQQSLVNDLIANLNSQSRKMARLESELAYLKSGWYNRFRTWVGCLRARHAAQMEDISIMLSQLGSNPMEN